MIPHVYLFFHIGIAHNRPGNKLEIHGKIQKIPRKTRLRLRSAAVYINHIGKRLEGVEGNADRKLKFRHGKHRFEEKIDVLRKKSGVLEQNEHADIENKRRGKSGFGTPSAAVFFDIPRIAPIAPSCEYQKQHPRRPPPSIENERKYKKHRIFCILRLRKEVYY